MDLNLFMSVAISVVLNVVILSPVLWLSGKWLAGSEKAKLTDAIWISLLGSVIMAVFGAFLQSFGILGIIITLVVWLSLIKHFFDCGWLKALGISIVALIILVIVMFVLVIVGITTLILWS